MSSDWPNDSTSSETGLFDGDLMPMLDEIIFDTNYMPGLQLQSYESSGGAHGDDGLDAFPPAAFLNDITTMMDGTKGEEATANNSVSNITGAKSNTKAPKKRKTTGIPGSPPSTKKARSPASPKMVKKSHLVPSSPASQDNTQAAHQVAAKVPEKVSSNAKVMEKNSADQAESIEVKSIAQAAVTALIANVDTSKGGKRMANTVDTSTAHVKALTGSNWVYASSSIANAAPPASSSSSASLGSKGSQSSSVNRANVRRPPLTADERASQNRDRNREHARNTRLRKKAYVDELKKTLVELVAQRDEADQEKHRLAHMEAEQKEVRFRVIEEFLKLRGSNEANTCRWSAILDEAFTLTLPVTWYRKMVSSTAEPEQVITGVRDCMTDAGYLSGFLRTFDDDALLQYRCDKKGFVMDGVVGVLEWEATVTGTGRVFKGSFRGKFCPSSNKLVSAKLLFDTGSIEVNDRHFMKRNVSMIEIDRAAGAGEDGSGADAILSSIGIPRLVSSSSNRGNIITPSLASSCGSDKDEMSSSDGSLSGSEKHEP